MKKLPILTLAMAAFVVACATDTDLDGGSGANIIAFKSPRDYTNQGYTLLISSPDMKRGSAYTVNTGATVSGGTGGGFPGGGQSGNQPGGR